MYKKRKWEARMSVVFCKDPGRPSERCLLIGSGRKAVNSYIPKKGLIPTVFSALVPMTNINWVMFSSALLTHAILWKPLELGCSTFRSGCCEIGFLNWIPVWMSLSEALQVSRELLCTLPALRLRCVPQRTEHHHGDELVGQKSCGASEQTSVRASTCSVTTVHSSATAAM